jgi:hypothetical protein
MLRASQFLPRPKTGHIARCLVLIAIAIPSDARAEDAGVTAKIAPQPTQPAMPQTGDLPSFHCDIDYCGFDYLRDTWKRKLPKGPPQDEMNADSIIAGRSRFLAEGKRWAETPPVMHVAIPGTDCAIGGYLSGEMIGIGCGSRHRDFDPRFVCVNDVSCTPTMQRIYEPR